MSLNKIKVNNTTTVNTGVVYDISKATGQSYDDLKAALGTSGNNVPPEVREGGMSVRFVHTGDNKYVQCRCIAQSFTTDVSQWLIVGDVTEDSFSALSSECLIKYSFPTAGSIRRTFKTGEKYIVYNKSGINIVVSTRVTPDGSSSNQLEVSPYRYAEWEIQTDGKYLRCGQDDVIIELTGLDSTYEKLKKQHNEQTVYNLSILDSQNIIDRLNEGEYGYSTTSKILYYKDEHNQVYQLGLSKDSIYTYEDQIYKYNGTELSLSLEPYRKQPVYTISVFDKSNIVSRLQPGEYGYNVTTGNIVQVVDENTVNYKPYKDCLYKYNDVFYVSDGDKLIECDNIDDTIVFSSPSDVPTGMSFQYPVVKGEKYILKNNTNGPVNIYGRNTENGSNIRTIALNLNKGEYVVFEGVIDINFIRIFFTEAGNVSINKVNSIQPQLNRIKELPVNTVSTCHLDTCDDPMVDVSSMFERIHYDSTNPEETADIMEQVYHVFDELVVLYPDYVKKYDPMVSEGTSTQTITIDGTDYIITVNPMPEVKHIMEGHGYNTYPEYCNGIAEAGTYLVTPAYKTYIYGFEADNSVLKNIRKNVFLMAGVHGNEKLAPVDLYMLASQLCRSTTKNMIKLRGAFNFYMLPELCGYSVYHTLRVNANGVNINRNFPTSYWNDAESGEGTFEYKGPSAGSEFETKLVMAVESVLNPLLCIDHHNYGYGSQMQYYIASITNKELIYRCCLDAISEFCTTMPEVFGSIYMAPNPIIKSPTTIGATQWAYENGYNSSTVEVNEFITFSHGEVIQDDSQKELFTNKVAKISEYTIRHYLTVYLDWLSSHKYIE